MTTFLVNQTGEVEILVLNTEVRVNAKEKQ